MKPLAFEIATEGHDGVRLETLCFRSSVVGFDDSGEDSSLIQDHPNRLPFNGVLLRVDEPSDQPPHGSDGHPILVPKEVAQQRLKSLIGMGVNYEPENLESHAPRRKVGVITSARIDGNDVKVRGFIWKKDFPEAEEVLRKNRGTLGMSMELGDVFVADTSASVWRLEKFHFTGATILKKDSAAYHATSLAASGIRLAALAAAARALGVSGEENEMAEETKEQKEKKQQGELLANAIAAAVGPAVAKASEAALEKVTKGIDSAFEKMSKTIQEGNEAIIASIAELASAETTVAARGKKDDSTNPSDASSDATNPSDSTMASAHSDSTADDDPSDPSETTRAAADPSDPSDASDPSVPGNRVVNKTDNSSRWSKDGATTEIKGAAGMVREVRASRRQISDLEAANAEIRQKNEKLSNKVKKMEAQIDRMTERVDRRTVTPQLAMLLEKNNTSVSDLRASGQKLKAAEVDAMFSRMSIQLDPVQRMAFKNELLAAGYLDEGLETRTR